MTNKLIEFTGKFLPHTNTTTRSEQLRSGAGALIGLLLTGFLSFLLLAQPGGAAVYLIAPMGASAVLLFCLPASPLAQPWSVIGGNTVSALVGITCAHWIADPVLAAPLAGGLAIVAMFFMRCLHPPGGAVALTAVLAGPAVLEAGYSFALLPVGLNSAMMVLAAVVYNNLTGRAYPHAHQAPAPNIHATRDPLPTERTGFTSADLNNVLQHYGQVLNVDPEDLENIIEETESQAYARRYGVMRCGEIMSRDVVTVEAHTGREEALQLMREHRLHTLPVLNKARRVIGIVSQTDFLKPAAGAAKGAGKHLRRVVDGSGPAGGQVVSDIMTTQVKTVTTRTPVVDLVPLMSDAGFRFLPVVDKDEQFAGVVTQSDMVAALYAIRLAEAA